MPTVLDGMECCDLEEYDISLLLLDLLSTLLSGGTKLLSLCIGGLYQLNPLSIIEDCTILSTFLDFLVCLEDGKKLKMLKRHLKTAYNMTPDEYRQRWGLPSDYPMVAPNYAAQRSKLAKEIGLGTRRGKK